MGARAAIALAVLLSCASEAHAVPGFGTPEPLPSASISTLAQPIDRYRAALAALQPLKDMVFQYTESRSGPTRTIVELHRVYRRDDGAERNETIAVNGEAVIPAIVHFANKPDWPYDVHQFAVSADEYQLMPTGPKLVDGKRAFGMSAVRVTTGDFAITGIYLDEKTWLPLRETYDVAGGDCTGTGSIDFGIAAGRWLPMTTQVSCTVGAGGATFKESIAFAGYTFPPTLPSDIFGGTT